MKDSDRCLLSEDTDNSPVREFLSAEYSSNVLLHTSMSRSKWLMMFTSITNSSPLMRYDGTSRDKEKSLDTVNCE